MRKLRRRAGNAIRSELFTNEYSILTRRFAPRLEGMMGNASFMIQNMIMMQAIQHFFSGYILVQIPFGLTKGFKLMTQKGIDLPTLSTR